MFKEINQAINNQNYTLAKEILTQLATVEKDNLWIKYYEGLIIEKEGNLQEAEANYRQIIKDSIFPDYKLIKLIRDGIERIENTNEQEKKEVINEFKNIENAEDLAVLILQPVALEDKKVLAPKLAKIMNIDNYTATLQIPIRSWRLYKTGNLGELNYYQSELSKVEIPCFCHRIENINKIHVYQVKYILDDTSEVTIICQDETEKEKTLTFKWEEIDHKIQGLIPIFELTVHVDAKGKMEKKKSTLDYVQFYDLHLLSHNLILRFNDYFYKFEQGLNISHHEKTTKEKWNNLMSFFGEKIPNKPLWSDFTLFGEGVIQFPEMLQHIKSHVYLFHRQENLWDETFQLYSGLIFLESLSKL